MKKLLIFSFVLISLTFGQYSRIGISYPVSSYLTGNHSNIEGKTIRDFSFGVGLTIDLHFYFMSEKLIGKTKFGLAGYEASEYASFLSYTSLNLNTTDQLSYGLGFGLNAYILFDEMDKNLRKTIFANLGKVFWEYINVELNYHFDITNRSADQNMDRIELFLGVII